MALTKTPIELSSTPGIVDNSNATAITIDASENVLVGKTATTYATEGAMFEKGSALELTTDSGRVLRVHRTTNDGNIIEFSKDSATVGSIGTKSSLLTIGTGTTGLIFDGGQIYPWNTNTNAAIDASKDLGASGARFKDLYLSGGAFLGGTAAANKLEDYEEGTWTPTVSGCTLSVVRAFYTKIGNLVTLHFNFSVTATNNASVAMSIAGKPFVGSVADSESNGSLMVRYATIDANTINLSLYTYSRGATIEIYQSKSNTANWVTLRKNQLQASPATAFIGSITYETDS